MGILLRVVQFAPLDGAKFMSPRFYRGNNWRLIDRFRMRTTPNCRPQADLRDGDYRFPS
jgi:hypothetical protein